jgi:hypothetical protein
MPAGGGGNPAAAPLLARGVVGASAAEPAWQSMASNTALAASHLPSFAVFIDPSP